MRRKDCKHKTYRQRTPEHIISLHFHQKVSPYKHGKICRRNEIHFVSSPKFGSIGPWGQVNRAHSKYISNHHLHALCFIFPTYDANNKS